jgi:hypothetical protein
LTRCAARPTPRRPTSRRSASSRRRRRRRARRGPTPPRPTSPGRRRRSQAADDERYFGDSLDAVSGAKARLDKADADTNATNATKKKVVDAAWAKLQELGVKENKYSVLTSKDTDAASASVGTALGARQHAWKEAQALEEKKEAKRKEFAAAAQTFVDGADKRRGELDGLQGEPEPLIKTLEEKYAGGKPENGRPRQAADAAERGDGARRHVEQAHAAQSRPRSRPRRATSAASCTTSSWR